jgi:hypothetical protein
LPGHSITEVHRFMIRRPRIAALAAAAVVALAVTGCANNDAKESDVVDAMLDAGLSQDEAECIGTRIDDAFGDNQDLYNDVASAADGDELAELPDDAGQQVDGILADCLGSGSGEGAGDTTDTTEADSETTDTTAGD